MITDSEADDHIPYGDYEGLKEQWDELYQEAREFLIAVALAPQKVKTFVNNVIIQAERDREAHRLRNELERREKWSSRHNDWER